jgi:proteasome lid subunit RPN8/RPN11
MICLSRSHVTELFRHLEAHYPHEACGVFLGVKGDQSVDGRQLERVTGVRAIPNLNTERAHDRYEMDPKGLLAAEKEARAAGVGVIGIWHSHPDHPARPSQTDLERAWPAYTYLIAAIREGRGAEWTCWMLNDAGTAFEPVIVKLADAVVF